MKSALGGIPVHQVMVSKFRPLPPMTVYGVRQVPAGRCPERFPGRQRGVLEGVLRQTDLLTALSRKDPQGSVASILRKDASAVLSTDMLNTVIPS